VNENAEQRIAARHKRLGIWCATGIALAMVLAFAISRSELGLAVGTAMSADGRRNAFLSILLRPYFLIPYLGLVFYGFVESWRARADWRVDRIALYVFLMCLVSVIELVANLVRLRLA
jgi:hypothetical protein